MAIGFVFSDLLCPTDTILAGLLAGGVTTDEQTSIIYRAASGELAVDAPTSAQLSAINIHSAAGIFFTDEQRCFGNYCSDLDPNSLFRSDFDQSFGDFSWGIITRAELEEQFLLADLTVAGSLDGGASLGDVDLVYIPVPEHSSAALLCIGLAVLSFFGLFSATRVSAVFLHSREVLCL